VSTAPQIAVTRGTERYEATWDGEPAGFATYHDNGRAVSFPHTVVQPRFERRGVASALARVALDDAVAAGRTIVPACSFFAGYVERHPEYREHVDPTYR
jgi:predicted GNAT family acetyltransferase